MTLTVTYDPTETTPDYLTYHMGATDGVTRIEAHVPYEVVDVDNDTAVAVLPNMRAAEDTMRSLDGDYYVQPSFAETAIKWESA